MERHVIIINEKENDISKLESILESHDFQHYSNTPYILYVKLEDYEKFNWFKIQSEIMDEYPESEFDISNEEEEKDSYDNHKESEILTVTI